MTMHIVWLVIAFVIGFGCGVAFMGSADVRRNDWD